MQSDDNRNLLLAIGLSVLVLIGWQAFFGSRPPVPPATPPVATAPGAAPQAGLPAPPATATAPSVIEKAPRATKVAATPRLGIDTPSLSGSISLVGGRIDDLLLKGYRETIDPQSPLIVLFSPQGTQNGYYADFGWVGDGSLALPGPETLWEADGRMVTPETPVTLRHDNGKGLVFTRKIAIDAQYMFTVTDSVTNNGGTPVSLSPYGRVTREGTPPTLGFFILHEGGIGFLGENKLQEIGYSDIVKAKSKSFQGISGGWLGFTDKYWATALVPDQSKPFSAAFGSAGAEPNYEAASVSTPITVASGATADASMRLFAGAKQVRMIDDYETKGNIPRFELLIDWGWFHFLTKPMFSLIDFFYKIVGNFGVAILLATVVIKAAFFWFANKSYESMAKMKAVQPQMLAIRERYTDDKMKQQQAMMELYRKEKINPLAGCLPILIQIPVFFALYKVLFVTIEMRHAPFFGWIKDLAAPDPTSFVNLFGLLPFTPPEFLHLGVWPIIMGITMFLQMKMNPEPPDPTQKLIFSWMPLIFTFMLASFPAGLVIYWSWNNLLSVAQQYLIMKRQGVRVELWDNLRGMLRRPSNPAS